MKSVLALSLAAVALAVPAPVPEWKTYTTPGSATTSCPEASTATATATGTAPTSTSTQFGGIAIRSGSEIQYASINANGGAFWINKNTTTYCPDSIPCPASNTNQTIFTSSNSGTLSLDVIVPGGQQVYVASDGQLKFTQAHSASTGEGSAVQGFVVADGALKFDDEDFFACPLGAQNGNAYGIYAVSRVQGSNAGEQCLNFRFRTQDAGDVQPVWQYQ